MRRKHHHTGKTGSCTVCEAGPTMEWLAAWFTRIRRASLSPRGNQGRAAAGLVAIKGHGNAINQPCRPYRR